MSPLAGDVATVRARGELREILTRRIPRQIGKQDARNHLEDGGLEGERQRDTPEHAVSC